jgi:hypothetical protein
VVCGSLQCPTLQLTAMAPQQTRRALSSGARLATAAWLGLSVFAAEGCVSSPSAADPSTKRGCPPPNDLVAVRLGRGSSELPVVKTLGACTPTAGGNTQSVYLQTHAAGRCHVELIFGSGATSSVDVNIMARWRPLGPDPRGCGQEFVAFAEDGSPCLPSACQISIPE